jgi:AcrR family transcriptional regulator
MTGSTASVRSMLVRNKLIRTAERLYAEQGLASVSVRKIAIAAGQRNKSAVQYHFTSRDELIKAILARHTAAIEKHRIVMVEALDASRVPSFEERMACLIMPTVEHHIELGTPSWYGRFLAQILVEPALREHVMRAHLNTPSVRRLNELGHLGRRVCESLPAASEMIRQFAVHMCAELEYDLAHGRIAPAAADTSWHQLGEDVIKAICGRTPHIADAVQYMPPLAGSAAVEM